jgi:hypothetical protein
MRTDRVLIVAGSVCAVTAASTLLLGAQRTPLLQLAGFGVGAVMVVVGLVRARGRVGGERTTHDPALDERVARLVFWGLSVLGAIAATTAAVIAIGQARGHAVFHLLTGMVCLGIFATLAFLWHPTPGSGRATLRGIELTLLALATSGSFVESLGGAGYDAANLQRRLPVLASLHAVGIPFGAFVMAGVPLGAVTAIAVLIARGKSKRRSVLSAP